MVKEDSIKFPGFDESASRIEFCCVRCFYAIPVCIVGGIVSLLLSLVMYLFYLINTLTIILLGKRSETLYDLYIRLAGWQIRVGLYFNGLTDERPPLSP